MEQTQDSTNEELESSQPSMTSPPPTTVMIPPSSGGGGDTPDDNDDTEMHKTMGENEMEEDTDEALKRSVYVGNVDYAATPAELKQHFGVCGKISRITIIVDKVTGHPKGYAYIEFDDVAAANQALMLASSTFKDRALKVLPKRKNIAGFTRPRGGAGMMYGPHCMMQGKYPVYMGMRMGAGRRGARGGIRGAPY